LRFFLAFRLLFVLKGAEKKWWEIHENIQITLASAASQSEQRRRSNESWRIREDGDLSKHLERNHRFFVDWLM